jgi:RHS repeat-associated protein
MVDSTGTTTYTYNAAGQRLTMNEAGSGTTTYSYDTAGRLASLVNPFSETTSFVYDTLGRVGQKSLANGTSEHYAYDTRSRLTQVQLKQGATVLRTTGYAWDKADQITSQTVNGVTTNYGYDLAGQLSSEVRTGYNVAYTYDANGNRLSKTVNGTVESYTYDLADKMLTAGAKSYTYDAAGRTVGINAPGGTTSLTYDYKSRVTAISGPGINETHTYNGLDTRVGTVQGGVPRTFVRDGSYVTDPVLRDGQATYTPGVSERRGGVSTWSHSGLKNADAQTTSVGAIAATRVYDAFGAELSATGTWKGPFGYAGGFGYQEDSSGLKLLGHRYYDPTTGRFLSRDPAKDGRNWYGYCGNDPIGNFDAIGLGEMPVGGPKHGVPGFPELGWKLAEKQVGNRLKWVPNGKTGNQSPPQTSWDPNGDHWDTDDGLRKRTRQDRDGNELTHDEAHDLDREGEGVPNEFRIPTGSLVDFVWANEGIRFEWARERWRWEVTGVILLAVLLYFAPVPTVVAVGRMAMLARQ